MKGRIVPCEFYLSDNFEGDRLVKNDKGKLSERVGRKTTGATAIRQASQLPTYIYGYGMAGDPRHFLYC